MEIEARIQGIPCLVRVTHYHPGCAARTNCRVDDSYPAEPEEIEYEILDRRGRPAPWLERKAKAADYAAIDCAVRESCHNNGCDDAC